MKKAIGTIAIALVATAAQSQTTLPDKSCSPMSDLATAIMTARQGGTPMSTLVKATETGDPAVIELGLALIEAAYERPRYNSPELAQREVVEFSNEIMLSCLKASKKNQ